MSPRSKKSRRSSLRKLCTTQQDINLNSSCDENSPTKLKIKRRVSFAEKKHVKEFCHSIEQGTVWDNTYEEHDLSHKGSDNQLHTSSTRVNKEDNNSKLNGTCCQNMSMEFTTAVPTCLPLSLSYDKENQPPNLHKDNDLRNDNTLQQNIPNLDAINCNDISMEITQPIPVSIISVEDAKYDNDSMELTNVIHSLVTDINKCANDDKKDIVFNTSMEMTTIVPSTTYERKNELCLNEQVNLRNIEWKEQYPDVEELQMEQAKNSNNKVNTKVNPEALNIEENTKVLNTEILNVVINMAVLNTEVIIELPDIEENTEVNTEILNVELNTEVLNTEVNTKILNTEVNTKTLNIEENNEILNVEINTEVLNTEVNTEAPNIEENTEVSTELLNVEVNTEALNTDVNTEALDTEILNTEVNTKALNTEVNTETSNIEVNAERLNAEINTEILNTEVRNTEVHTEILNVEVNTEVPNTEVTTEALNTEILNFEINTELLNAEVNTLNTEINTETSNIGVNTERRNAEINTEILNTEIRNTEVDTEILNVELNTEVRNTEVTTEALNTEILNVEVNTKASNFEVNNEILNVEVKTEILSTEINTEALNTKLNTENIEEKQYPDAEKEVEIDQHNITNIPLIEENWFPLLVKKLEIYAERRDCIWYVYKKSIEKKRIVFGFILNSLLIVLSLSKDLNCYDHNFIKEMKVVSLLADNVNIFVKIVHGLVLEKINAQELMNMYKTYDDILPMLDFVSQNVKLTLDFMFDLKQLDNLNLMDIAPDKISFVSLSKRMNIILKVTINIKRFDKLTPNDINFCCLLGMDMVREKDVKNLIINVKKDHKFLRRYMDDVKKYADIMEETY